MRVFSKPGSPLDGVVIAPLWRRLIAWAIDALLIFAVDMLIGLLVITVYSLVDFLSTGVLTLQYDLNDQARASGWLVALFIVLPYLAYHTFLFRYWSGHTPGKNFVQIRVLDKSGRDPNLFQGFIRTLLMPFSVLPVLLGFVLFLRSRKNTSLHDLVANTIVLQEEVEHRILRGELSPTSLVPDHS